MIFVVFFRSTVEVGKRTFRVELVIQVITTGPVSTLQLLSESTGEGVYTWRDTVGEGTDGKGEVVTEVVKNVKN